MNVLISLRRGYGLGDSVQVSSVLRHIKKYRPSWIVDFQAEEGRHQVGRGIVANTFAYGEPYPTQHYDSEIEIKLFNTLRSWIHTPHTHIVSCLYDQFGLCWDAECGRYQVNVSANETRIALEHLWKKESLSQRFVCIHTEGDTAKDKKDLTPYQSEMIRESIRRKGRMPLFLKRYSGNAETNCALIQQCEAFIGIDSGPAKCASATETPSLVIWTGHHPMMYHDPAPNTTHLVPKDNNTLPIENEELKQNAIKWFESNYNVRYYTGDPTRWVNRWLFEVLE